MPPNAGFDKVIIFRKGRIKFRHAVVRTSSGGRIAAEFFEGPAVSGGIATNCIVFGEFLFIGSFEAMRQVVAVPNGESILFQKAMHKIMKQSGRG
jgi:hypothetical protein